MAVHPYDTPGAIAAETVRAMSGRDLLDTRRAIRIEIDDHGAPSPNIAHLWSPLDLLEAEIERRILEADQ